VSLSGSVLTVWAAVGETTPDRPVGRPGEERAALLKPN